VWPGDGCQPGFWANRLQNANTTQRAKIKGFITIPTEAGYSKTNSRPENALATGYGVSTRTKRPVEVPATGRRLPAEEKRDGVENALEAVNERSVVLHRYLASSDDGSGE
jgi:hypothetical protein